MPHDLRRDLFKGIRILVIDDDIYSLNGLTELLTHYSAEVEWTHSGYDGVTIARETEPNVILISLPVKDLEGKTLVTWLKEEPHLQNAPLIALVTSGSVALHQPIRSGFSGILTTPVAGDVTVYNLYKLLSQLPGFQFNFH